MRVSEAVEMGLLPKSIYDAPPAPGLPRVKPNNVLLFSHEFIQDLVMRQASLNTIRTSPITDLEIADWHALLGWIDSEGSDFRKARLLSYGFKFYGDIELPDVLPYLTKPTQPAKTLRARIAGWWRWFWNFDWLEEF